MNGIFMFGGGLMMWLFWIGIAILVWLLFKGLSGGDAHNLSPGELLDQRLAKGEITQEEYARMKEMLEHKD